jgi:hypothetical protein
MTINRALQSAGERLRNLLRRSEILYAVQVASWESWRETISWLGFNVLGSFMPLWGSFFLLRLANQPFVFRDFMKHGEFALYTAAFLAPALQSIVRNLRNKRYVLRTGPVLLSFAGLLISAIVYGGVAMMTGPPGASTQKLNEEFLFRTSWIILPASLVFVFCVTLIQNQMENPNVSEIEESQRVELRRRFERKVGTGDAGK